MTTGIPPVAHEGAMHIQTSADFIVGAPEAQPIDGWVLPLVCEIDNAEPGFLRRLIHAGTRKRQTIFALLSQIDDRDSFLTKAKEISEREDEPLDEQTIGACLFEARPRHLIEAAYGDCPDHFQGCLGRMGGRPLPREVYSTIYAISQGRAGPTAPIGRFAA